jgi:Flp pilus assembly protein TadD
MMSKRSLLLISACALSLQLAACASSQNQMTQEGRMKQVDAALINAAQQTTDQGVTPQSLTMLGSMYKSNPEDPTAAIRYARGLKEADELAKARIVLEPFYKKRTSSPVLKTEYASVMLQAGEYQDAERAARKAIEQDPSIGLSYHILGIALDAQGAHPEAEAAFRSALENWMGDPVPVMNNLALSLTAQGHLDEAAEILYKAKEADPNRMEIERNLRIVDALRATEYEAAHGGKVPQKVPVVRKDENDPL